jgi:alginate O-acetyltransferase complex protein AlgI
MIFNSLDFVFFIITLLAGYWLLPQRAQNILLLVASYIFYGYVQPWLLLLIISKTLVTYVCAIQIDKNTLHKKVYLIISIVFSILLLGVFKYFNFFIDNFYTITHILKMNINIEVIRIALPAGISFYTFQGIGYTIDVNRGQVKASKSLIDFALFVAFFPQLVAGPIERAGNLLLQIQASRKVSPILFMNGFTLLMWGFFKKVVVADNVATICNKLFLLKETNFAFVWVGVFAFSIQIYADFSAYTDIARGCSRLLGFELLENFRQPYFSKSISEFWRRWHISLSYWFRDYLYIPLGGSRVGVVKSFIVLMITFFVTGLWHGARWTFIIWGCYFGLLITVHRIIKRIRPAKKGTIVSELAKIAFTYLLVCIGWLLFREHSVQAIFQDLSYSPFQLNKNDITTAIYLFMMVSIYALPLIFYDIYCNFFKQHYPYVSWGQLQTTIMQTGIVTVLFLFILILHSPLSSAFIYFQF